MSKVVTPAKQHCLMYENEKDFFWFTSIRDNDMYFINKYFSRRKKYTINILDAGCGTGYFVKFLKEVGFNAKGFDYSSVAVDFCQKRGLKLGSDIYQLNIFDNYFKENSFDCIILNDVLFAFDLTDTNMIFLNLNRILKPGGILIGQTAAFNFLYSQHDEVAGTKHRYNKNELTNLLKKNNYQIDKISYRNFLLFIPFMLKRLVTKNKQQEAKSDLKNISYILNITLKLIFKIDNFFLRYVNYPFGGTVFFIAKKTK